MRFVGRAVFLASAFVSIPAFAQSSDADRLFKEGTAALDKGLFDEACPKLAESHKLDPQALGTLVNLARCNEEWGKTATAYAQYGEIEAAAKERKQTARVELAQRRRTALTSKLSRITVKIERLPGEIVKLDGADLPADRWNNAMLLDPGSHVVEVSATDRETWKHPFDLLPATNETINVPELGKKAAPVVVAPPAPEPKPVEKPVVEPPREEAPSDSRKTIGFVVGGAGIVALGVGAFFGVRAISKNNDVGGKCPNTHACDDENAKSDWDTAHSSATLSSIFVPVGVVALGVGAFLVITAPKKQTAMVVSPMGRGVSMKVTF